MTAITYTAVDRGTLYSGHAAGTSYDLETSSHAVDPVRKEVGSESVAKDGATESTLDRIDRSWSVSTDLIENINQPLWDEFIDSVAVAESFSFDALGTIASPVNVQTVIMVRNSAKWKRVGSMYWQLSFKLRVI